MIGLVSICFFEINKNGDLEIGVCANMSSNTQTGDGFLKPPRLRKKAKHTERPPGNGTFISVEDSLTVEDIKG